MNEEIYSREQKRLALMFNVFMKASFVPGRLIVNKSNPPDHAGGLFLAPCFESASGPHPSLKLRNRRDAYARRRRRGYRGQRRPAARVGQHTCRANLRAKRSVWSAPSHSGRTSASSTSATPASRK